MKKTVWNKVVSFFKAVVNWFFPPNNDNQESSVQSQRSDDMPHWHAEYTPITDIQKKITPYIKCEYPKLKGRKWIFIIRRKDTNGIICEYAASTIKEAYFNIWKMYCQACRECNSEVTLPILVGYYPVAGGR